MNLLRGIVHLFVLKLFLIQVSSKLISYTVGETIYEYDNETTFQSSYVYKGTRKEGNITEEVVFKVSNEYHLNEFETSLYQEKIIYETIGDHDSIPKFYHYFPRKNRIAVLVIELLGNTISALRRKFKPLSNVTILRIGLQVLDILEFMHRKGVIHNDLHLANIAVSARNASKICVFDFDIGRRFSSNDLFAPGGEKIRREDISHFAANLRSPNNNTWEEFYLKTRESGPFEYEDFRKILKTELEKHKHEPSFDKFEWQISHTNETNNNI